MTGLRNLLISFAEKKNTIFFCMILSSCTEATGSVRLVVAVSFFIRPPNQFFGEVLSSQNRGVVLEKNVECTSIVARVMPTPGSATDSKKVFERPTYREELNTWNTAFENKFARANPTSVRLR